MSGLRQKNDDMSNVQLVEPLIAKDEPVATDVHTFVVDSSPQRPGWALRVLRGIDRAWDWLFGAASLIVGLALLATLPVFQLLSLGYLLEVSGRVARTGRLRGAFIGVRKAARVGSLVAGAWLLLWIPRFLSSLWADALLIDPASRASRTLGTVVPLVAGWVVLHVAAAAWRGGRLRHFLWPRPIRFLRQVMSPACWHDVRDAVAQFFVDMHLPHYFWLGLRGFVGGLIWLALPITLLVAGARFPLLGVLGGLTFAAVVWVLPFLQARMAREDRFVEVFAVKRVLGDYLHAPVVFVLAVIATLVLAVPLYLLKIELIPREAAWLPSLLFVVSMWPARVLSGWALARAERTPRRWWRTTFSGLSFVVLLVPLALAYTVVVYLTQYLSWYGMWSLYEQHAFLVPVPFFGG